MFKKIFFIFLSLFLLFPAPALAQKTESATDEIIVKFQDEVNEKQVDEVSKKLGLGIERKLSLPQTFTIKIPDQDIDKHLKNFEKNPFVEYAEPDYLAQAYGSFVPNDSYFSKQWSLGKILAPEAWDINKGSQSAKIAILDSGIDEDHEDLKNKIDLRVNLTSSQTNDDLYGHGTHVAGIAAAETNNLLGIAGLGFNARLLSFKVLDDKGFGYYSWIAEGLYKAADSGAKVINLSLGGQNRSKTLERAVDYAWGKGVVLACAAGNSANKSPTYPAYYKNCLAVAATDENDQKADFSSFGSWVDLAAPGVNIFSTFPNHTYKINKQLNYDLGSGTSMATPLVSGLAGLLFGADPTLSSSQVRNLIEENTDKIAGTGNYWLKGRINAYKAIAAIPGIALPSSEPKTAGAEMINNPVKTDFVPSVASQVSSLSENQKPWWCYLLPGICR